MAFAKASRRLISPALLASAPPSPSLRKGPAVTARRALEQQKAPPPNLRSCARQGELFITQGQGGCTPPDIIMKPSRNKSAEPSTAILANNSRFSSAHPRTAPTGNWQPEGQ